MTNMNQGDLFNLIVNLKFARQIDIARVFSDNDNTLVEKDMASCINRAIKGKTGKPLYNIIGSTSKDKLINIFFSTIFKDCDINAGASTAMIEEKYQAIQKHLIDHHLTFRGMEKLLNESADCEIFVKRMIQESLEQHLAHSTERPTCNEKKPCLEENVLLASPILHSQTIYCPSKFFSREGILEKMYDTLQNYKLVILCGIGGIGKTYLSRQYAHLYVDSYDYMQIVTYDKNSKSIKKTILSLQFDNLNESKMNDSDKFEKRLQLLNEMHENTLLIIDNIDVTPNDLDCFDTLCTNSGIHIIVTTRLTDCFSSSQTINISSMPIGDQIEFFKFHYSDTLEIEDISIVENILKCIDGHTLLIELVAKTMQASNLSPAEMLAYLKGDIDTKLLPIPINKDNLSSQKRSMSDFVKLLFDVSYLNNTEKDALLYLSLLPIKGVSRKFFYNLLPNFCETFNTLESTSWLIKDKDEHGQVLRLHPVIRDMIRKEMHPSINNCRAVTTNIHSHLQNPGITLSESDKTDICNILESISEIENFYNGCSDVTALIFFAKFCYDADKFELALNLYKTTASVAVDSPVQTITAIHLQIGDVYKRLAYYNKSIESYNNALASNTRQHPGFEKNLQDADIYERLSDIYRKDSQYDLAMQYNNSAISIYETPSNCAVQTQLAEIYNRRGIIFLNKADSKEITSSTRNELLENALKYYYKALHIREDCHDTTRQLAYSYHNIGSAYYKLGEYKLAKDNHEKALQLRNSSSDIPTVDIASSHVWIGNDYMALGDAFMLLAKEHFEKSLEIRKTILGKTHPEVAWSLISLSEWYEKNGEYQTALTYARDAYDIRIKKFSPSHNYVRQVTDRIKRLEQIICI